MMFRPLSLETPRVPQVVWRLHVYLVNACLRPQQLTPLLPELLAVEYLPFTDGAYYGEVNFGDTLT